MAKETAIQWCDSTLNAVMGCCGCELWPTITQLIRCVADFLTRRCSVEPAIARTQAQRAMSCYELPTDIYHARTAVADALVKDPKSARALAEDITHLFRCYAGFLHLIRGLDETRPQKKTNKGYAPKFERVTLFPGRMAEAAKWSDLRGKDRPEKPWLDGLPRLGFLSDMSDFLSPEVPFTYLRDEVIANVSSPDGSRHLWLWLTKLPGKMAELGRWLEEQGISWPENLVAMTSITSTRTLGRVEHLRQVPARLRALSVEPLLEEVELDLTDIDWVIVGGESGSGARPFDLSWARTLRDACRAKGIAFFMKQLGANPESNGNPLKLRDSHGGDWDEWHEDLRVREFPLAFRSLPVVSAP